MPPMPLPAVLLPSCDEGGSQTTPAALSRQEEREEGRAISSADYTPVICTSGRAD